MKNSIARFRLFKPSFDPVADIQPGGACSRKPTLVYVAVQHRLREPAPRVARFPIGSSPLRDPSIARHCIHQQREGSTILDLTASTRCRKACIRRRACTAKSSPSRPRHERY
jgi:hypothetical protein